MSTLAKAIKEAGSLPAGVLLFRLRYWMPKATLKRGGFRWVAKTRNDWLTETGLTAEQYRDALKKLKDRRLVVVEQHFFGNRSISWMREKASPGLGHLAAPGMGHVAAPQQHQIQSLDTTVSTNVETGDGKNSGEDTGMPTVKEIMAGGFKKKPVSLAKGADAKEVAKQKLAAVWVETIWSITGKTVPPLTAKERGQLDLFVKKVPGGKGVHVIKACLGNWTDFAIAAKSAAGLNMVPLEPHPGFLLKYVAAAMEFAEPSKADTVNAPVQKPVQLIAPAKPAKQAKMSLEDFHAIEPGSEE